MKNLLRFCSVSLVVVLMGLSFTTAVLAANQATVTATVTLQNVSVTVSDGTITYGTLAASSSKSTTAGDLNDLQTATNNGNVAEDFNIKGQATASWTLGSTAAADTYVHKYCTTSCTTPPTNYTALTTNYQTLGTDVATSGTQTFDLQITMPTTSSVYTSQSVDVTVQATAH